MPSTQTTQSKTQSRDDSAAVCGLLSCGVPTKEGRVFFEAGAKSPESSSPDGAHSPKALAFWARKAALRKQPHRCTRCAKPHKDGGQCPACRAYAAEYRARKREKPVTVDSTVLARLERRIGNLEHYFAQLSAEKRIAYNRGYCAGRRLHRKAQERASYREAYPDITLGELATINHAYGT